MSTLILFGAALQYLLGPLIMITSLFLIILVLVQRGRGGGLTGALGGPGGQSAFGTKAGDVFTRVTSVVAIFWILLSIFATMTLQDRGTSKLVGGDTNAPAPLAPGLGGDTGLLPGLTVPSDDNAGGTSPQNTTAPAPSE